MSGANPTQLPVTDPKKFLHVSAHPYHLPAAGVDPNVDNLIARGEMCLRGTVVADDGKTFRAAVSKGVTYRRYPVDGRDRREHRAGPTFTFPNHAVIPLRDAVFA
jgi:hypothetical protein